MGRPKQFEREHVLAKATAIFRRHGFSATSTQQLVEGLGINRKSMYAEFGSKQGLFEAALDHYDRTTIQANFGPLETDSAGLPEIEAVVNLFAGAARSGAAGLGCLLCNTAVERAANDADTSPYVDRYFDRLTNAFERALGNAKGRGALSKKVDVLEQARFFTTSVIGIAVLVRAKALPELVDASARVVLTHLHGLRSPPPRIAE